MSLPDLVRLALVTTSTHFTRTVSVSFTGSGLLYTRCPNAQPQGHISSHRFILYDTDKTSARTVSWLQGLSFSLCTDVQSAASA